MRSPPSSVLTVLLPLAMILLAVPARGASLLWLGDLSGGQFESRATGVSANGTTVVGASRSGAHAGQFEAFRWTAEAGMVGLYSAGEANDSTRRSYAYAVDATGTCVVGETTAPDAPQFYEAVIWKNGAIKLGGFIPGGKRSVMLGVDDHCTQAVGASRIHLDNAVRFLIGANSVQVEDLGIPQGFASSTAIAIAGQAPFIGGSLQPLEESNPGPQAFRRTPDTPYKMQGLGAIHRLSSDGTIGAGELDGLPARWTTDLKLEPLPLPAGFTGGEALGLSPNGKTIVGRLDGPGGSQAFVWSAALGGMRVLSDLLAEHGVELPEGVVLVEATGVAADESTIVGTGLNAAGKNEAYRVSLEGPQPGSQIVAGSDFACALFDQVDLDGEGDIIDGTHCWGDAALTTTPPQRLIALAAGGTTACGLDAVGVVACWGDSSLGQHELVGRVAREIRGGDRFMCIRNTADRLECTSGAPPELADLGQSAIATFDVGDDHACVVAEADGSVQCAGAVRDPVSRLEPPVGLRASQVFLGRNASCAIEDGGTAKCWGSAEFGQAANPDGAHAEGAGGPNHICMVQEPADGEAGASLYCQGHGALGMPDGEATPIPPDPVDGPRLYSAVAAGGDALFGFTCALDVEGRPFCFGADTNGEACPPNDRPATSPPGDEDCDGIPSFADNCFEVANADQLDSDGDGVGDECDECADGIDQIDMDEDGIPDACDQCKGRDLGPQNPECPVSVLYLVTPAEAAEIVTEPESGPALQLQMASAQAAVTTTTSTTPEVFKLVLDCGQDTISATAGAFAVPTTATMAVVGNNCGIQLPETSRACDTTDPNDRLGATVDPASSTVITLDDPNRGSLAAGTIGFKFRNNTPTGLCGPGQTVRLADVLIYDNVPGLTPALSLTGVTETLGPLIESDAPIGQEPELLLRGFTTAPVLTVKFRPQLGGPANETSVFGDAPWLVDTVRGSIVGATGILGCNIDSGIDTCSGMRKWRCQNDGAVESTKLPQKTDFGSVKTYVLGPGGSSTVPGIAANQIFYTFQASLFTTSLGTRRAFNAAEPEHPDELPTFLTATIRTDASGSPAYVTDWPGQVFCLSAPIVAVQTLGGQLTADGSDNESSIKPGLDPDGDLRTENDKCPFVPDDDQDGGGRQSPLNPTGAIPNGIGNYCECGDVNKSTRVDGQDRSAIASFLIGNTPANFDLSLCNVSGAASFSDAPGCGVEDVLEQDQNFQGKQTGIEGKCAAFTGAQ